MCHPKFWLKPKFGIFVCLKVIKRGSIVVDLENKNEVHF